MAEGKPLILYVDDDPDYLEVMRSNLATLQKGQGCS